MADDKQSKMPDMKEIGAMASKLYKDVKESICEIISDYKVKHPPEPKTEETKASAPEVKPEEEVVKKEKTEE